MEDNRAITLERMQNLEPLSSLSSERLEELLTLSTIEYLPIGVSIFREGDIDNQTVYLLDGDVQLSSSDGKTNKVITTKQKEGQFPLDDSQPHQVTGIAMSRVEIMRIDNSVLDYMMMWDQLAVSEAAVQAETEKAEVEKTEVADDSAADTEQASTEAVIESSVASEEDGNWIRKMRHIMAFKNMPPANIKSLLERMETFLVQEGDVIVKQGEPGDYYYVLTEGSAQVTRTVELARLEPGSSFGEEALVSGGLRNATVTMCSEGMLMRLSQDDFNELLKDPMLDRVVPDEARVQAAKGALWLDVRHAKEYHHSHLPKAINIPLHEMRIRMAELDKDKHYICYCGTGRRSSAAAFLLIQNGYQASVLKGGVQVMAQDLTED